jgi:hypothetical protein
VIPARAGVGGRRGAESLCSGGRMSTSRMRTTLCSDWVGL